MEQVSSSQAVEWREGRRLRAWELHEAGWSQAAIAEALGVTPGAVSPWMRRAREGGGAGALRCARAAHAHRARGVPPAHRRAAGAGPRLAAGGG